MKQPFYIPKYCIVTLIFVFYFNLTFAAAPRWTVAVQGTKDADYYKSIAVIDDNTIYVVTSSSKVMKTTDGGVTWTTTNLPTWTGQPRAICFPTASVGYVAGDRNIAKTTDGGTTWNMVAYTPATDITSAYATSTTTCYFGGTGKVYYTTDGGLNFSTSPTVGIAASSLFVTSNGTVYRAGGSGGIYMSTDGAASFSGNINTKTANINTTIPSIYFSDINSGYAVGLNKTSYLNSIIKTSDGGTTWINYSLGTTSTANTKGPNAVCIPATGDGFVVGTVSNAANDIYIRKTTDAGETFSIDTVGAVQTDYYAVAVTPRGDVYVAGNGCLLTRKIVSVEVTSNDNAMGNISSVSGSYYVGENIPVTATPNTGYHFVNWTEGGIEKSTTATYNYPVTATKTLQANFASNEVSIVGTNNVDVTSLNNCSTCDVAVSDGTLTVNVDKTLNNVTLEPNSQLKLSNKTLSVNNLIIKADKISSANISVTNAMSVTGNVHLYKTLDNTKWYFISFPSDVAINDITQISGTETLGVLGTNWWIKYYDGESRIQNLGTQSNWKFMNVGETLVANKGYIITLATSLTGDYVLSFPLNKNLVTTAESTITDRTVAVEVWGEGLIDNKNTAGNTVADNHKGWNLVGIPYLSKFAGNGVGNVTYLTLPKSTGIGYDQSLKAEVGRDINPFEAFFIQASTATTTSNLSFATSSRQLVRSVVDTDLADRIQLNFTSISGTDKTNLIISEEHTPAYEINKDLEKWITTGTDNPQVYSLLDSVKYAYNALPLNSLQNLPLGFYTKTGGSTTISIKESQAVSLSKLILKDNITSASTDLLCSNYSFIASEGTDNSRFVLSAQRISTEINATEYETGFPTLVIRNRNLFINNLHERTWVRVFDATGRLIFNQINPNSSMEIKLQTQGMYTVQFEFGNKYYLKKIVN
jgi:hypothetical protein